ncbi:MAG: hypothetical protein R3E89_14735 [Thiolinea sp.]
MLGRVEQLSHETGTGDSYRYASTRLPAKALRVLHGKTRWCEKACHEQAMAAQGFAAVVVATDDQRIREVCESFGASMHDGGSTHQVVATGWRKWPSWTWLGG